MWFIRTLGPVVSLSAGITLHATQQIYTCNAGYRVFFHAITRRVGTRPVIRVPEIIE